MVIDTDGSAFITKAEFDALKNNFQSQIDNYNSSIDSKIDGATASYLSGITVSLETNVSLVIKDAEAINWINRMSVFYRKRHFSNTTSYTDTYAWQYLPDQHKRYIRQGRMAIVLPFMFDTMCYCLNAVTEELVSNEWWADADLFSMSDNSPTYPYAKAGSFDLNRNTVQKLVIDVKKDDIVWMKIG